MQRTNIEWVVNPDGSQGFTWNPIVGCTHGCLYCYARRQARRMSRCKECQNFRPHLHANRLDQPADRVKPSTIFVGSMAECFDREVHLGWLEGIEQVVARCSYHTFLFLTKRPLTATTWPFLRLPHVWTGTTIDFPRARTECITGDRTFLSFEPLLGPLASLSMIRQVSWIIVGSQSGPKPAITDRRWVGEIVQYAQANSVPVFVRNQCPWEDAWGPKPRALPYINRPGN